MKKTFLLSSKEFALAISIAILGFIFSTRFFILWMNSLNPLMGLLVYYVILYSTLFILSKMGLVVFGEKIEKPTQILGVLLIMFAFFIVVDWESPYIQLVVNPSVVDQVACNYFQAEDGAVWFIWQTLFPEASPEALRLLTYVASPFILATIGGFLATEEPEF